MGDMGILVISQDGGHRGAAAVDLRQPRELRLRRVVFIVPIVAAATARLTTTTTITAAAAELDSLFEILNADLLDEVTLFHTSSFMMGCRPVSSWHLPGSSPAPRG
jgi:hypothetical protein